MPAAVTEVISLLPPEILPTNFLDERARELYWNVYAVRPYPFWLLSGSLLLMAMERRSKRRYSCGRQVQHLSYPGHWNSANPNLSNEIIKKYIVDYDPKF